MSFSEQVQRARVVVKKVGGRGLNHFITSLRLKNNFEVIPKSPAGKAVKTIFKTIDEKAALA